VFNWPIQWPLQGEAFPYRPDGLLVSPAAFIQLENLGNRFMVVARIFACQSYLVAMQVGVATASLNHYLILRWGSNTDQVFSFLCSRLISIVFYFRK
jgi:hypothetical protein